MGPRIRLLRTADGYRRKHARKRKVVLSCALCALGDPSLFGTMAFHSSSFPTRGALNMSFRTPLQAPCQVGTSGKICASLFSTSVDAESSPSKTQYTIDDSVCSPTATETLQKAVHKACLSLEIYSQKKPMAAHTKRAFEVLVEWIRQTEVAYDGIVLDSGCGTGRSTKILAETIHPNHLVIGVDRSFARLTKTKDNRKEEITTSDSEAYCHKISENAYLVRAELVDFWRSCIEYGWATEGSSRDWLSSLQITHHYMLYPNPYPTKARLSSRWYAHPGFPLILKLGAPSMVIRSNWEGYLKEFALAVALANEFYSDNTKNVHNGDNLAFPYLWSAQQGPKERLDKRMALTNFENKYDAVGEATYELSLERKEGFPTILNPCD